MLFRSRKGNNAQLCSCTALLQINLFETVLHVEGQGFVARCSMCACFYRYTTASWSKGFLSCEACKYVVADEQQMIRVTFALTGTATVTTQAVDKRLEMIDEALEQFSQLKGHVTYFPALHYYLAKTMERHGNYRDALRELETVLRQAEVLKVEYACATCGRELRKAWRRA